MAANEEQDGAKDIQYQGDAILLSNRVTEVEREQTESKERDEEYKTQQLAINSRMAKLTFWLVICTAATGGIAVYQATVARRSASAAEKAANAAQTASQAASDNAKISADSLKEIQKSGTDTHELAVQAKNQADRTLAQAQATNDRARQSKRSADIAQNTFDAANRPYIGVM